MTYEEEFIKHRKSFKVAPYASADVIGALSNDSEYHVVSLNNTENNL